MNRADRPRLGPLVVSLLASLPASLALGAGCELQPDAVYGRACDADAECGPGYVCRDERCVPAGDGVADGGPKDDAGHTDAGARDAGAGDGGLIDGGLVDGGLVDGGLVDGGGTDAGLGDGGADAGGLSIEDLPDAYFDAFCSMLTACNTLSPGMTPERCPEMLRAQGGFNLEALAAGVRAGRIAYDPTLAAACLGSLSGGCVNLLDSNEACEAVFRGLVPAGGACWDELECASGTWCREQQGTCEGVCEAYADVDDPCGSDAGRCADDAFCNDLGVCELRRSLDAACDFDSHCESGLRCEDDTCQPFVPFGGACSYAFECEGGYSRAACVGGACVELVEVGAGAGCSSDWQCPEEHSCVDHDSDSSTSRICQPWLGVGGTCSGGQRCAPGLLCDATSGLCRAYPTLDESCSDDCAWSAWCDLTAMMCVAPQPEGSSCDPSQSSSCAPGLYCQVDEVTTVAVCAPKRGAGEPCDRYDQCASDVCDGTCTAVCTPPG